MPRFVYKARVPLTALLLNYWYLRYTGHVSPFVYIPGMFLLTDVIFIQWTFIISYWHYKLNIVYRTDLGLKRDSNCTILKFKILNDSRFVSFVLRWEIFLPIFLAYICVCMYYLSTNLSSRAKEKNKYQHNKNKIILTLNILTRKFISMVVNDIK